MKSSKHWLQSIFKTNFNDYSKTCVKWPLSKRPRIGFQDQLSLNAGQKYCRMLQGEPSAIFSTFFKLPSVIKNFCVVYFELPFYTGFTVYYKIYKFGNFNQMIPPFIIYTEHQYTIRLKELYLGIEVH